MSSECYPIDAVVAWVDGNDPVHRAKRARYDRTSAKAQLEDIGGETRFVSVGEIKYCVASILRFAPFIRKIFIVTDQQNPGLDTFLDKNFPVHQTQIEIVDHQVIFRDHEEVLPVFNSLSIESVLWRIPDLSDHFIYFNDDVMLAAPTKPEDFFVDDKVVCYAEKFSLFFARFLRAIKPKKHGHKVFGYKDAMVNACDACGQKSWFPYIGHMPLPQKRSLIEEFFEGHPELMAENMKHRFREPSQFNVQVLCYMLGLRSGKCLMRSKKGMFHYLMPKPKPDYVQNHLERFDRHPSALFCCFNGLDQASEEDRKRVISWLEHRIGVED